MSPPKHNANEETRRIYFPEDSPEQRLSRLEQANAAVQQELVHMRQEVASVATIKTDVAIIKNNIAIIKWFVGSAAGAVIVLVVAKLAKVLGI